MRLHCFTHLTYAAAALILSFAATANAQTEPEPFNSLRTPPSPAFTLLGIEPSAVERPSTPADFALTFLNKAAELPSLPKNFAVEASPFWLKSHPTLTWQLDATRTPWQSIQRTFTVSTATYRRDENAATDVGIGFRTSIWSGQLTDATRTRLTNAANALGRQGEAFLDLIERRGGAALRKRLQDGELTTEQFNVERAALIATVESSKEFQDLAKPIKDLAVSREGFMLEVAGAATWQFAGEEWETRDLHKTGIWVTPSYQSGHWNVVGVLRYIGDELGDDASDVTEWGARPIYTTATWTASVEYLRRHVTSGTGENTYRFAGIVERRFGEDTWVTATFGRDRARDGKAAGLLAQLGLNINVGKERFKF